MRVLSTSLSWPRLGSNFLFGIESVDSFFAFSTWSQSNNFKWMLGSNSIRLIENWDRERSFVYFTQLAHRGRGEKKKEWRICVDLKSCTGKTERWKSQTSMVGDSETEAENQCEGWHMLRIKPRTSVSEGKHSTPIPPPPPASVHSQNVLIKSHCHLAAKVSPPKKNLRQKMKLFFVETAKAKKEKSLLTPERQLQQNKFSNDPFKMEKKVFVALWKSFEG